MKAQATHQFAWYTPRTSLGANGMPDKLIKEDLRQQSMNSYDVCMFIWWSEFIWCMNSHNDVNSSDRMNSNSDVNSYNVRIHIMKWIHLIVWIHIVKWIHLIVWIHIIYEFIWGMISHNEVNLSDCMNSHNEVNSSD